MILEAVRLLLVVALVVVLPGFLLVNAAFPPGRSRLSGTERTYLAATGGILLVVLVGVVLGFLPHGRRGYFSTSATGFPHVELWLLLVSAGLFWIGLQRGAYPALERRFRAAGRSPGARGPRAGSPPP